ncbi:MAG: DNA-3-methyladenine glycosylase 2 family protein, partial [Saprospiraceae bacterium]|nr:DNA-3-methyladenine glycosylase 2 family protein [Saprospiraceae bacterium]
MSRIRVPPAAVKILSADEVMGQLLNAVTINFPPSRGSVYEDMIEAIVYQQISIKAARSIFDRFLAHFGGAVPGPVRLTEVPHEELRMLGLSNQKAMYIRNIAAYFAEQKLTDAQLRMMDDDAVITRLTEIK